MTCPDHILHTNGNLLVVVEATKEADNIWGVTLVQDDQLPHDLCPHHWLNVQRNQLTKQYIQLLVSYLSSYKNKDTIISKAAGKQGI